MIGMLLSELVVSTQTNGSRFIVEAKNTRVASAVVHAARADAERCIIALKSNEEGFGLDGPVRRERLFDASTDRPAPSVLRLSNAVEVALGYVGVIGGFHVGPRAACRDVKQCGVDRQPG